MSAELSYGDPESGRLSGQDRSVSVAAAVLDLTHLALQAADLAAGVMPTLDHLVRHTAAVGAAYFQAAAFGPVQQGTLSYQVRAAAGAMPSTPGMAAIAAHGLPANVPLMLALHANARALFFDDTLHSPETQGFSELGVASVAAAPVRQADGQLIGAFLMHTFEPHTWDSSEAVLFSMVSGTIAALAGRLAAEEQMREAHESSLHALGLALEARDGETQGHTSRVTTMAMQMADALGLGALETGRLRWGAYLHDIGKIAIPDAVLLKLGRLTPEEWQVMQSHVEAGVTFASALSFLPAAALNVVAQHHERWDGSGYPNGLASNEISLEARIFALCDVYDALTSVRPYKLAWAPEDALAEIQAQSGRHFDPDLVPMFVQMVRRLSDVRPGRAAPAPDSGQDG